MNRPEETVQRAIVQYLELRARRENLVFFAVPNQRGTRSRIENAILKGLGVRPGVSDLVIVGPRRVLFVEVKAPGKERTLSVAQARFGSEVRELGHSYVVATSIEDVSRELTKEW